MAWVATALYISGALVLGFNLECAVPWWQKVIAIVIAILITVIAVRFINWQFDKRLIAFERTKLLLKIAKKELIKDSSDDLNCYFKSIEEYKSDPNETRKISRWAMGLALIAFIILICF